MATFTNASELDSTIPDNTSTALSRTSSSTLVTQLPIFRVATSVSPGHAAILEMHANSQSNALVYIMVVLGLYILGMSIVVIKYIRTERYEARLTRLFHNLVQRDRFFRLSRRRSSLPKCVPPPQVNEVEDDLPLSPIIQIPEIHLSLEDESKL